jgi:hypothetical protein
MADENENTQKPESNVPPKLDLKQAVNQSAPPLKKSTTRIDMASAAMVPEEKSKTTRINLGAFTDATAPKTIKIQRPTEAATIKLNRPTPVGGTPPSPLATPPAVQAQTKRQTSRIPLQEAFTAPTEGQADAAQAAQAKAATPTAGPKTIRIKRPGDGAAAPASMAPPPAGTQESEAAEGAGPLTQRKTIKFRRSGTGAENEAPKSGITLPKSAQDFADAQAAGPQESADEPGLTFALLSLAAVVVAAVLVYVLCVQAFPQLGLSWPGQIPTLG